MTEDDRSLESLERALQELDDAYAVARQVVHDVVTGTTLTPRQEQAIRREVEARDRVETIRRARIAGKTAPD